MKPSARRGSEERAWATHSGIVGRYRQVLYRGDGVFAVHYPQQEHWRAVSESMFGEGFP